MQGSLCDRGGVSYLGYDALFGAGDTTFFRGGHPTGEGNYMIAEIIEKGDATITIRYNAVNGQEAMLISMMGIGIDKNVYVQATGENINIGSVQMPVLESLSKKFAVVGAK